MSEWWQKVKLYQPMHFFQEVEEMYGGGQLIRKCYIKGSGYTSEKISESVYEKDDLKFTLKIRRHGYQITKRDARGTITRFYHDLKDARELL